MWDLIVSVPDHCLSFYFSNPMCSYCSSLGVLDKKEVYTHKTQIPTY